MAPPDSVDSGDQQFLALLVHKGFLGKEDAMNVLKASDGADFNDALTQWTGWDEQRLSYLRRTRALSEPDIPGYLVEKSLGFGGTSEVFGALREKDRHRVALKILKPMLARDSLAAKRFVDEAKILQSLEHPAIVHCHRVFRFLDTFILEMDWVSGRTLEEHLAEGEIFPEHQALKVVVEVADALEAMRVAGVVHRDLKPGNLMLDNEGSVRLIDLGFAGDGAESKDSEETTLGTPAYLSPEQARGEGDLDVRADIYSLGVTLFHLTLGRLPFQGANDAEMMRSQVLDGLNGAAMKGLEVSPRLHYLIEKMMAKDREVRYSSPAALIADIRGMDAKD